MCEFKVFNQMTNRQLITPEMNTSFESQDKVIRISNSNGFLT